MYNSLVANIYGNSRSSPPLGMSSEYNSVQSFSKHILCMFVFYLKIVFMELNHSTLTYFKSPWRLVAWCSGLEL